MSESIVRDGNQLVRVTMRTATAQEREEMAQRAIARRQGYRDEITTWAALKADNERGSTR